MTDIDDAYYRLLAENCIRAFSKQVDLYLSGKTAFGFLVGQILRVTRGEADPRRVEEELRKQLEELQQKRSKR